MENFITYDVEYLGGHPEWPFTCKIELTVRKTYREIFIKEKGFLSANRHLYIKSDEIISIDFEEKKNRSIGKVATGAVIGGILTGGIGLLAGGVLGSGRKNNSNLYITITRNGKEFNMVFKTGKYTNAIYAATCGLFG
ncbi:MAG: hypothetical protein KGO92_00290 [Bacteroidota bacterium]|nr:hypothetical protein [Bacteroidota bacterium]